VVNDRYPPLVRQTPSTKASIAEEIAGKDTVCIRPEHQDTVVKAGLSLGRQPILDLWILPRWHHFDQPAVGYVLEDIAEPEAISHPEIMDARSIQIVIANVCTRDRPRRALIEPKNIGSNLGSPSPLEAKGNPVASNKPRPTSSPFEKMIAGARFGGIQDAVCSGEKDIPTNEHT